MLNCCSAGGVDADCCKRMPSVASGKPDAVSAVCLPLDASAPMPPYSREGVQGDGWARWFGQATMRPSRPTAPKSPTSGVGIVWRVARAHGIPNDILVFATFLVYAFHSIRQAQQIVWHRMGTTGYGAETLMMQT